MKDSAVEGCECCVFLVHCIESEPNFADQDATVLAAAPVSLVWWEISDIEDSGAYLFVQPGGCEDPIEPKTAGRLEVKLELFTMRGNYINPYHTMLKSDSQR